jgi:hypothetical protein
MLENCESHRRRVGNIIAAIITALSVAWYKGPVRKWTIKHAKPGWGCEVA